MLIVHIKADSHLQVCSNKKRISSDTKVHSHIWGGDKNMAWYVSLVLGLEIHSFAEIQVVHHAQPHSMNLHHSWIFTIFNQKVG